MQQRSFTTQATKLGDYLVPPGVFVYVLFHRLHNNAKFWREPNAFRPERWDAVQPQPAQQQAPLHAENAQEGAAGVKPLEAEPTSVSGRGGAKVFLPFSDGSRNCVAQVGLTQVLLKQVLLRT